jgi:cbb3-type cytochrome oxidase subunit 3
VATGEVPVAPILVAFVVLVLVLGSWFAFRSANRRGT